MYILFKAVNEREQGIVQTVGRVLNYTVGYLPETHTDIADYIHLKPKTLTEEVNKKFQEISQKLYEQSNQPTSNDEVSDEDFQNVDFEEVK